MSHYLWQMRPYFRQVAGQLLIGSIAGIAMNTAVVLPAILLGRAIDTALGFERGEQSASAVGWAALAFAAGTAATEGPRIFKRWWLGTARARIAASVRADALRGVLDWPMERLHDAPVGNLMARIIGDVEVLRTGVGEVIVETWDTLLFSLSLVVAMLFYDAGLTVLALLPAPAALLLAHATGRWVSRRVTAGREANADLTAMLQEQLAGIRVLRLFGRTGAAVDRFSLLSLRQAAANRATMRLSGGLRPLYSILITSGVVLVVWQGGERVVAGGMTVGALVAYIELYLRFVGRAHRIPQMVNSIQSGAAAYARLRPLLAPPLSMRGEPPFASFRWGHVPNAECGIRRGRWREHSAFRIPHSGEPVTAANGERPSPMPLSFDRVTFRYPGAATPALWDISFDVPAGALVAITGPVGSGKSALARALLGLYPLEAGRVLLDGRPLEEIPVAERAAGSGYLPQEPHLFSGTVRENILLAAEPASGRDGRAAPAAGADPALAHAVEVAALNEDLRSFPEGMETEIGELGIRVSGGQRQRIALARAIAVPCLPGPRLLVLDDPFSAVDVDTEAAIVAGLRAAFGPLALPERRATIVLCSHRLAAFPQADMVMVLDDGRIEEQGTHAELLAAGGLYARIYRAQQRAERADSVEELMA